jgi:L-lactate dehydrogenase complex protein LldG
MTPLTAGLMQRFKHSAERAGTTTEVVGDESAAVAAIAGLVDRLQAARVTATSRASRLAPAGSLVGGVAQAVADADLGVSTALAGVAETGSVLLGSNVTEDRLIGMLAQTHVVVIEASSIVASLDDIAAELRRLTSRGPSQLRYCTLVTGPSRTADIERVLTVGVQGPRALHLIVVEAGA